MDEKWIALARRAVACRDWSWQPGMLAQTATSDVPDLRYLDGGCWWDIEIAEAMAWRPAWVGPNDPLPDLTDPATLGCLLALVREGWRNGNVSVAKAHPEMGGHWGVEIGKRYICGDTEAEALVAALEAAPR